MHHAARGGKLEACQFLIRRGAEINAPDEEAMTPLHHAAEWGGEDVCRLLLDKGAKINARDRHDGKDVHTPLFLAIMHYHNHLAPLLLRRGADVTIPDHRGWTPLHTAASRADEDLVKTLLARGAELEAREQEGCTPLMAAIGNGMTSMAKSLVARGANVNATDDEGTTPLVLAVKTGQEETVDLLLDGGAKATLYRGGTLLHKAARHEKVLAILLTRLTIDVNVVDPDGHTARDYARPDWQTPAAKLLVARGAKTGPQLRYQKYVLPPLTNR